MVVDTSALIAILLNEPDAEILSATLAASFPCIISDVSFLEASIVMESKKGEAGLALLDELITTAQFEIAAFDDAQHRIARDAYRYYGKDRHPAGLKNDHAIPMMEPRYRPITSRRVICAIRSRCRNKLCASAVSEVGCCACGLIILTTPCQ